MARTYKLANLEYRKEIDLRKYSALIIESVQKVVPNAKVTVNENDYIVHDDITSGDARKIGKILARSKLGKYCLQRPVLFESTDYRDTFLR